MATSCATPSSVPCALHGEGRRRAAAHGGGGRDRDREGEAHGLQRLLARSFAHILGYGRVVESPDMYRDYVSPELEARLQGPSVVRNELRFFVGDRAREADLLRRTTFHEVTVGLRSLLVSATEIGQSVV
jgi:hypothetical protein